MIEAIVIWSAKIVTDVAVQPRAGTGAGVETGVAAATGTGVETE